MEGNAYQNIKKAIMVLALIVTALSVFSAIMNWYGNMRFVRNQKRISSLIEGGNLSPQVIQKQVMNPPPVPERRHPPQNPKPGGFPSHIHGKEVRFE